MLFNEEEDDETPGNNDEEEDEELEKHKKHKCGRNQLINKVRQAPNIIYKIIEEVEEADDSCQ